MKRKTRVTGKELEHQGESYRLMQAEELLRSLGYVPVDPTDPHSPWKERDAHDPSESDDAP